MTKFFNTKKVCLFDKQFCKGIKDKYFIKKHEIYIRSNLSQDLNTLEHVNSGIMKWIKSDELLKKIKED